MFIRHLERNLFEKQRRFLMFTVKKRLLSLTGSIACIASLFSGIMVSASTTNLNSAISDETDCETEQPEIPLPSLEPMSMPEHDLKQDVLAPSLDPVATLLPTPEPTAMPVATPEPSEVPTVTIRIQPFREIKAKKVKFLYAKGYIRVRKKATQKSSSKFLLKPGQKVKIIKESGKKWVKIRISKKKTGYVQKKFLDTNKKKAKKIATQGVGGFRITGYCPCYTCSEGYGRHTASGRTATAGRTIAADTRVLPMYTEVYIKGLGRYTVEDVGGGVKGRHIDVFVNTCSQCSSKNRSNAKVYLIRG